MKCNFPDAIACNGAGSFAGRLHRHGTIHMTVLHDLLDLSPQAMARNFVPNEEISP